MREAFLGFEKAGAADSGSPPDGMLAARLLRGAGALVLVASLGLFLLQGWAGASDLHRFALLLAQTALLAVAGVASGRWLQEPKGARVFVAIALVAVVANFAVLGGLLWSAYGGGTAVTGSLAALRWEAAPGLPVLAAGAAALPVLWAIARLGFAVLARPSGAWLSALLLVSAATLVVPARDNLGVAVLVAVVVVTWLAGVRRLLARDPSLRTAEGFFALALLLLPAGVLLGRGLLFHEAGIALTMTALAALWVVLREGAMQLPAGRLQWRSEIASAALVVPLTTTATQLAVTYALVPASVALPLLGALVWVGCGELSLRARAGAAYYGLAGTASAVSAAAVNALLFDGLAVALIALAIGVAAAGYAVARRQAWMLSISGIAALVGFVDLVGPMLGRFQMEAWGWLALVGAGAVLFGSIIERGGVRRMLAAWASAPHRAG